MAERPSAMATTANSLLELKGADNGSAYRDRGNAFLSEGKLDDALACYRHAIAVDADTVKNYINLAYVLGEKKQYRDAEFQLKKVLELDPANIDTFFMLGNLFKAEGNANAATEYFNKTLSLKPGFEIRYRVLFGMQQYREAVSTCDEILQIEPADSDVHVSRGIALLALNEHEAALDAFDRALRLKPESIDALLNRGTAQLNLGRHDDALQSWADALKINPHLAAAHCNESVCRLQMADMKTGWQKYEWRWKTEQLEKSRRQFEKPLWIGNESLTGKTILLHDEQGFGDTIQFCRYASQVRELGATVILMVQAPLKSLLAKLAGANVVLTPKDALPDFDFHCPLMSLPLAFNTRISTIMSPVSYIDVAPTCIKKWRVRLDSSSMPRIGLVWSGSAMHLNDRNRSIPFSEMLRLVSERAKFISLQKEVRQDDLVVLKQTPEVRHFGSDLQDFTDTAGLIANVDLVISVDTSVAHLAGAMGKPVWLLLPFNADWRWLLGRSDSPWYPSMRLFRQRVAGNWGDVLDAVAAALHEELSDASGPLGQLKGASLIAGVQPDPAPLAQQS